MNLRRWGAVILLALVASAATAQELGKVVRQPEQVLRNNLVTFSATIDYADVEKVRVRLPDVPESFALYSGPVVRRTWATGEDGKVKEVVRISVSYLPRSYGRFVVPMFLVDLPDRTLKFDADLVSVGYVDGRGRYIVPFGLAWDTPETVIWVGQTVPVVLNALDLEEILLFNQVDVDPPRNAFLEEAPGYGSITTRTVGGYELYQVPAAAYLFTPTSEGRITLPGADAYSGIEWGSSDPLVFEARELPESLAATGAVGEFEFSATLDRDNAPFGEEFVLSLTVSGRGNLGFLAIPDPDLGGATITADTDTMNAVPDSLGYAGTRTRTITFLPDTTGPGRVVIPAFPQVAPSGGLVDTGAVTELSFDVEDPRAVEATESPTEHYRAYSTETLRRDQRVPWYQRPYAYLWLLAGPVVFIPFVVTRRRLVIAGILLVEVLIAGVLVYEYLQPVYRTAPPEEYATLYPRDPRVRFNESLESMNEGKVGQAVFEARTALYLDPSNSTYRSYLRELETAADVQFPAPEPVPFHPDFFFFILLGAFFLLWVNGIFFLRGRTRWVLINSVVLGVVVFLSLAGLGAVVWARQAQIGVVLQGDAPMRKIPDDESSAWSSIREGNSLVILGEQDGYYLVRNGLDRKGWVSKDLLGVYPDE